VQDPFWRQARLVGNTERGRTEWTFRGGDADRLGRGPRLSVPFLAYELARQGCLCRAGLPALVGSYHLTWLAPLFIAVWLPER